MDDAEALIEEARRRARRRRRWYGAAALLAAGAAAAAIAGVRGGGEGVERDPAADDPSPANVVTVTGDGTGLPETLSFTASGTIHLLLPDGTHRRFAGGVGPVYGIAWSADGARMLIVGTGGPRRSSAVFVLGADGILTAPIATEVSVGPVWSPDGRRIAYQRSHRRGEPGTRIYVTDLGTGATRAIASNALPGRDGSSLSWSGDGRRIVYAGKDSRDHGLFLARADSAASPTRISLRPAPPGRPANPAWSPDGSTIAFEVRGNRRLTLYAVRPDGTALRRLARGGQPAWSPDGSQVAFVGFRARTNGVVNAGGSGLRRLPGCACGLRGPGFVPFVSWSSDGSRLAYVSHAGNAISTVSPTGGDPRRVALLRAAGTRPGRVPYPDLPVRPLWRPAR